MIEILIRNKRVNKLKNNKDIDWLIQISYLLNLILDLKCIKTLKIPFYWKLKDNRRKLHIFYDSIERLAVWIKKKR